MLIQLSSNTFEMRMMPIFTKLFVISIEASNVFGDSSSVTMRRYDGCFFVLSRLISLYVSEKNATSEPATRKDIRKSVATITIRMMVAVGVMAKKVIRKEPISE